jgi:oligopeptide/dipeptide ABC transporter ATP-binding protein
MLARPHLADPAPILQLDHVVTVFERGGGLLRRQLAPLRAVDDVSLTLHEGEILGLVGESGCGKSTLGRTVLGIQPESAGEIRLDGKLVSGQPPKQARVARRDIQYVYQDPAAALDPWWAIGRSLAEALVVHGISGRREREQRIDQVLDAVGLDRTVKRRYPHELSGGQLRRVGLARILILSPRVVILDEPTSGLDLSVQATVLRLIRDLQERLGLTYIFISHDLSVVERICQRVAIMYLGRIVELADTRSIFAQPRHPYTQALLAAAPRLQVGRPIETGLITGEPPSAAAIPSGCGFRTRCPHARELCGIEIPPLVPIADRHEVACIRWREIAEQNLARSA